MKQQLVVIAFAVRFRRLVLEAPIQKGILATGCSCAVDDLALAVERGRDCKAIPDLVPLVLLSMSRSCD